MEIKQLTDDFEKRCVARIILEALPEWFQKSKAGKNILLPVPIKYFFALMIKKDLLRFKEFEVFPTLWSKRNPCQIYIMCL